MKRTEEKSKDANTIEENLVRTKRQISEEILKHLEQNPDKKRFAPDNLENLKVNYRFGQKWNCGSLDSVDDVFYFANQQSESSLDLLNRFYNKICYLNPSLKNISVKTGEGKYHLLRGVGSRCHYNDIKYFIEDVKCSGTNGNYFNKTLNCFANLIYDFRYSFKNQLDRGLDFVLSPQTAIRSILNVPYNKNKK